MAKEQEEEEKKKFLEKRKKKLCVLERERDGFVFDMTAIDLHDRGQPEGL